MGASQAKNVTKDIINAITNVSVKVMAKQSIGAYSSQGIIVSDTYGDVNISDINQTTKVSVNMDALLKVMDTEDIQQAIQQEIKQSAKAITKGINLFNFSNAYNELDDTINEIINVTKDMSQTCKELASTQQEIQVSQTHGNVNINHITQSSMVNVFSKCYTDVISQLTAVQKLQQTIDQSATAKTEGFSLWAIVILVAVVVIGIVILVFGTEVELFSGGANFIIKLVLNLIFPGIFISGIIMLIVFFVHQKTDMDLYGFSKGIGDDGACEPVVLNSSTKYDSPSKAGSVCKKDNECAAFDWVGNSIDSKGKSNPLATKTTTFYSHVDDIPCSHSKGPQDQSTTITADVYPNTTGYKIKDKKYWLLWSGATVMFIGLLGTLFMISRQVKGRKKSKHNTIQPTLQPRTQSRTQPRNAATGYTTIPRGSSIPVGYEAA